MQTVVRDKIKQFTSKPEYSKIVFIDAASTLLGSDDFEKWLSLTANADHFRKTDPSLANDKDAQAKDVLIDWRKRISSGQFVMYIGDKKEVCSSIINLYAALSDYVLKLYPLSFDNMKMPELYTAVKNYSSLQSSE